MGDISQPDDSEFSQTIFGCLLGTAVGDAIGLPYEGLSACRARRIFGPPTRHRFLFGRGMVSDDTEHACMIAQSLIQAPGDVEAFARVLASKLKWWFVAIPAGVGMATVKSCTRLLLGWPPDRSGVMSAGNGPLMRAPMIGLSQQSPQSLSEFTQVSSRITHRDQRAIHGAVGVALLAQEFATADIPDANRYLRKLQSTLGEDGQ